MRCRRIAFVLVLGWCAAAEPPNTLSPAERRDGWTLLFDGSTTQGWEEVTGKPFPSGSWKVEDGCLRASGGPNGMQDIRTSERFAAFELQFEWKLLSGGNSGVKYFIQRVDEWVDKAGGRQARGRGFEYQLATPDAAEAQSDPKRSCGALYGVLAPRSGAESHVGEFNTSRIVVRSSVVEHWLNGKQVLSFSQSDPLIPRLLAEPSRDPWKSHIVLQNHRSDVWFRNLKIRRLE
jgi:hypothetical protein